MRAITPERHFKTSSNPQRRKAKNCVNQNADPKYIKAPSVPYSLKTNVELELERLEREGIISPAEFSEWAAPIVPVAKPNGKVRICGHHKLTVKQVSKLENYPIPKTGHLLAAVGGGEKLTKLTCPKLISRRPWTRNRRCLSTRIKAFSSITDCFLESPLHLEVFRGQWKTSCKAFLM